MIPREIERRFDALLPVYGRQTIESLRLEYMLNPGSRGEIEALLIHLARRAFGSSRSLPVPPKGTARGEYVLGGVTAGSRSWDAFGLREGEWIQHMGVFGRTGSGKTNVGFLILRELRRHRKPFLVFDWKRNYRDLRQLPEFADLTVLTVGRDVAPFRFNPLIPPPGTEPTVFVKKLIEILMHVYWLGDGVAYLLQKAFAAVYRADSTPTVFDVRAWLRDYTARGRERHWMDSTRRVIETLCFGQIGRVLKTASNRGFERLLDQPVVLELEALSNADKTFLIEAMLLWLHLKRMREPDRERFKHAILIEEAHHVLLKHKESKETVTDIILREIRELGEAIIFLDQHPSLVSVPSLGNSYCTIAMNLKHGNDVAAIARALGLQDEERQVLGRLPVGEAVVKLQGRWVQAFRVRFPHLAVSKGRIADADLKGQQRGDSGYSEDLRIEEPDRTNIRDIRVEDRDTEKVRITSEEARLLEDVLAHPTDGVLQRIERLSVSADKFYVLLKSIEASGLAISSSVSTLRGRKRIIMPTPDGAAVVGADRRHLRRHESPQHWYWKMRVAEEFARRGRSVAIEHAGADLVIGENGRKTAVEIETGKSDAVQNVRRNLANGFDHILVIWVGEQQSMPVADSRVRSIGLREFFDTEGPT